MLGCLASSNVQLRQDEECRRAHVSFRSFIRSCRSINPLRFQYFHAGRIKIPRLKIIHNRDTFFMSLLINIFLLLFYIFKL